ncbi:MAG: pyruvate ferredoxin oxidoreductase, partial [Verrucomicrobiales bacterium]|nr:pyruvate ferredoxin oxidoreductase [Verrucomicrobiales bacterium]
THAAQVKHMMEMFERAILHPGFSVVEVLSECVIFYPGAFDEGNPRKGGEFGLIEEKAWDDTPEDEDRHDVTNEAAAYKIACEEFPGRFGVFLEMDRPTKNQLEQRWIDSSREKVGDKTPTQLIGERFASMK